MDIAPKKSSSKIDKNPYDRRAEKDTKKAFKSRDKEVAPVARDTNKTRRKTTRERTVGATVKTEKPAANLKKAVKKGFHSKYE